MTASKDSTSAKIRLGISSCLLGEKVRFDGGHKLDRYLRDTLGQYIEYVPVCPEVECGLPVPRESMRLVGSPDAPRLVAPRSGTDLTAKMQKWAQKRVAELASEDLDGFIFKSRSPSSGMERVKVYSDKGMPRKVGVGLFAQAFINRFPHLPTEEEGRLHDPLLRENFIERIFVSRRFRAIYRGERSLDALVDFHTRHKLLLMSHNPKLQKELGRIVALGKQKPLDTLFSEYFEMLMTAMKLKATKAKHVNVLQHIMGYFKKDLAADEKQELLEIFDNYRRGFIPLVVPVTMLNHLVRKYDEPYLKNQVYLFPHPVELMLRNHV